MRLYLDANAIIYSIEGPPHFRESTLRWIEEAKSTPEGEILTSRLSTLECRVKPLRHGATDLLARYDGFFRRSTIAEIGEAVLDQATELCARFGLKTPDAIHVATAMLQKADLFLTADARLARCPGVNFTVLE